MKILIINCGSSSIKFQLIETINEKSLCKGLIENINSKTEKPKIFFSGYSLDKNPEIIESFNFSYENAISYIIKLVTDKNYEIINSIKEVDAIGHRVVHGGEKFSLPTIINEQVINEIKECNKLAPLHNPHNLEGILACLRLFPFVPQTAVFDTAFHQSLQPNAYLYGLPYEYYLKYKVRKYGFHGTSHLFVTQRANALLNRSDNKLKIISCHLGNGASITAVKNGKSIDTSMGFTPLEGLIMGTRSGDIDPAIVPFLMEEESLSPDKVNKLLNEQSGLIGISGLSSDVREILKEAEKGNDRASLAIEMFVYRIKKYISAYFGILEGADAIIFTAGIGENSPILREKICKGLECLGIELDIEKNKKVVGIESELNKKDSKVKIFCIPTNEELSIAKETMKLIKEVQS